MRLKEDATSSKGLGTKLYLVFIAILLLMITGFLIVSNWRILGKTMESVKLRQAAEVNLSEAAQRERELSIKLDELETEDGLDKEIRTRFPVAMPGEEVIMIVPGDDNEIETGTKANSENWWDKWVNFFKK